MGQYTFDTISINRCESCDRSFECVGAVKHWRAAAAGDYVPACCECAHPDEACWHEAERGPGRRLWKIVASIALIVVAAGLWLAGIAVILVLLIGLPFLIGVAVGGGGSGKE